MIHHAQKKYPCPSDVDLSDITVHVKNAQYHTTDFIINHKNKSDNGPITVRVEGSFKNHSKFGEGGNYNLTVDALLATHLKELEVKLRDAVVKNLQSDPDDSYHSLAERIKQAAIKSRLYGDSHAHQAIISTLFTPTPSHLFRSTVHVELLPIKY